jgi:hypothetical protein
MFRAHRAYHQERQIVSIQPLVTVTLCWWPCRVPVGSLLPTGTRPRPFTKNYSLFTFSDVNYCGRVVVRMSFKCIITYCTVISCSNIAFLRNWASFLCPFLLSSHSSCSLLYYNTITFQTTNFGEILRRVHPTVKWSFWNCNKVILSQIPWEYYFHVTPLSRIAGVCLKKGSEWKISVANICPKSGVKVSAERDVKYELVNLIWSTESGLTCRRYYGRTCGWTTSRSCGLAWCQGCPVFKGWHIRSRQFEVMWIVYRITFPNQVFFWGGGGSR